MGKELLKHYQYEKKMAAESSFEQELAHYLRNVKYSADYSADRQGVVQSILGMLNFHFPNESFSEKFVQDSFDDYFLGLLKSIAKGISQEKQTTPSGLIL